MRKTGKVILGIFLLLVMIFFSVAYSDSASADAWWGYGARRPDWVLSHGGTIVRFEIEDTSGENNEYKAVMYDADGDYVEKEFGTKGLFDDAKNGAYVIKVVRGDGNLEFGTSAKGGKKFAEIKVTAHPGETMKIKFNYKKKTAKMTTDYIKPVPKPIIKASPVSVPEPVVESKQEVETFESSPAQIEEVATTQENDISLAEFTEEFFHPDALASVSGQQTYIRQANYIQQSSVEKESTNIFKRIWSAVAKFFSFG